MTPSSYGATSRRPVYSGTRKIPGLYERTLANGTTVYDASLRIDRKQKRFRLEALTKTDAIMELNALRVDYDRGEPSQSPASTVTLNELATDFGTHMAARINDTDPKRRRSPKTVAHYGDQLRLHVLPVLGHRPANEVTVADVRRLLDALAAKNLSPSARTGMLTILSSLLRYGVRQGALERNPVRDLDRDDRPGAGRLTEPRYLTLAEVTLLLDKMGETFRPIAATCAYAGLRASEALGLRWQDVDLKGQALTVSAQLGQRGERVPTKTAASAATVPLLPALATELTALRKRVAEADLRRVHPDAFVFSTARGKPQGARNTLRAVYAAGDAAELNGALTVGPQGELIREREPVGLHDLRHSFVALALASGLTLPEASSLARHANPGITAKAYAGLTDADRKKLGAKLAEAFGS